jgi:hypothetical protein
LVEVEGGVIGLLGAEAAESGRGAFQIWPFGTWRDAFILAVCAGERSTAKSLDRGDR